MNKKRVLAIIAIVAVVAIMTVCLCACNAESITKKLEKKGYGVHEMSSVELRAVKATMSLAGCEGGIEWGVVGTNGKNGVSVIKFEKSSDAKSMRDFIKGDKEDNEIVKLVGKVVFVGTEQGVKDAM